MLKMKGYLKKEGKLWGVECPDLFAYTFGESKAEALRMMEAWVKDSIDDQEFEVHISSTRGSEEFELAFPNPVPVLALMLRNLRSFGKISLREAGRRTAKDKSRIQQIERGLNDPGFSKYAEILEALGYDVQVTLCKRA